MNTDNKLRVVLFFRKRRNAANYSIESSFNTMLKAFPSNSRISPEIHTSSYFSNGLIPRIRSILEARRNAGEVNHITGDIHFVAFGLPGRSTLLTIHDCGFMKREMNPLKKLLLKWIWLDLPVHHCRFVTAVSEATKKDIVRLSGCSPDKVVVIPTVINGMYTPEPAEFNTSKPRILHIGLAPNKNFDRHAAALQGISCTFHIVGKLQQHHRDTLDKLGIEYINGYNLTSQEILNAYHECDIVLFASTLEGFGMPIIEGQSVGRPIVTSNISSMPEVAGNAACLVDPFNVESIRAGILQIINNSDYRNTLISNGFENIKRFRPETVARQYEVLYEKIAGQH